MIYEMHLDKMESITDCPERVPRYRESEAAIIEVQDKVWVEEKKK